MTEETKNKILEYINGARTSLDKAYMLTDTFDVFDDDFGDLDDAIYSLYARIKSYAFREPDPEEDIDRYIDERRLAELEARDN